MIYLRKLFQKKTKRLIIHLFLITGLVLGVLLWFSFEKNINPLEKLEPQSYVLLSDERFHLQFEEEIPHLSKTLWEENQIRLFITNRATFSWRQVFENNLQYQIKGLILTPQSLFEPQLNWLSQTQELDIEILYVENIQFSLQNSLEKLQLWLTKLEGSSLLILYTPNYSQFWDAQDLAEQHHFLALRSTQSSPSELIEKVLREKTYDGVIFLGPYFNPLFVENFVLRYPQLPWGGENILKSFSKEFLNKNPWILSLDFFAEDILRELITQKEHPLVEARLSFGPAAVYHEK